MIAKTGQNNTRIRRFELAEQLGVSTRTIDRWVRIGLYGIKLRAWKIGRSVGFTWADVESFRKAVDVRLGRAS